MAAKKVKAGVYTLTRDLDGEFALWPEEEQLKRVDGFWRSTRGQHRYRLVCGYPDKDDLAASFPTIRKGACVRVTVEVIDD